MFTANTFHWLTSIACAEDMARTFEIFSVFIKELSYNLRSRRLFLFIYFFFQFLSFPWRVCVCDRFDNKIKTSRTRNSMLKVLRQLILTSYWLIFGA